MAAPTAREQHLLEQINFARLAPQEDFDRYVAEYGTVATSEDPDVNGALRFFGVDGRVLRSQVEALTATHPLAWNDNLGDAAKGHSREMARLDTQAHTIGDSSMSSRVRDSGYAFNAVAENIYAYADNELFAHAGFMVDWGFTESGIQSGVGHRTNIMNPSYREAGIGVVIDTDPGTRVGELVVTQNFGNRGGLEQSILLGAVRREKDGDGFYSVGEGMGNVRIRLSDGTSDKTAAAGGYDIGTRAGETTVSFTGKRLDGAVKVVADLPEGNAKIDLISGDRIESTVSLELKGGVRTASFIGDNGEDLRGNGLDNRLDGNGLSNRLEGRSGDDTLRGEDGRDQLLGGSGRDRLDGGKGRDLLKGQAGDDSFVFSGTWGADIVADLSEGDALIFRGNNAPSSVSAFRNGLSETDAGVLFDIGRDGKETILFRNVSLDEVESVSLDLG